jgi:transcriptional antiterminator NusG
VVTYSSSERDRPVLEWFALRVRSNSEWITAEHLRMKGFETCLPMCRPRGRSRKKNARVALFPGYVFCLFDRTVLLPILTVPWVIDIVGRGRVPEAIDPHEIHGIQVLAASELPSEARPYLAAGERVKIEEGPLEGVEGILIREKGQDRLVISVSLLLRSVTVEVDSDWVTPLSKPSVNYAVSAAGYSPAGVRSASFSGVSSSG